MLSNKVKFNSESLKNLVCPTILLIYAISIAIIFLYFLKFITQNINSAFAPAFDQAALEKTTRLNLTDYNLLKSKLDLETTSGGTAATMETVPATETATTTETAPIETVTAESANANPNPDSNISQTASSTAGAASISTELAPAAFNKADWKMSVINSTTRTGLAGELKKRLEAVGYQVIKIGNQSKPEDNTIISFKPGLDRSLPEISEINQIVSQKYDFVVSTLPAESPYDIEIVIGRK